MSDTVDLVLEDLFDADQLASLEDEEIALDIAESRQEIASLEAHLLDVESTLALIRDQGGVCRATMESHSGYLPVDYPLESFTQKPTMTNLDVATASLEDRKGWLIGAIVTAVVALIAKLLSWIFGRNKSEAKVEANKSRATKDFDRASDLVSFAGSASGSGSVPASNSRFELPASFNLVAETNQKGASMWNAFSETILTTRDPAVKALFSLQRNIILDHTKLIMETKLYCDRLIDKGSKIQQNDQTALLQLHSEANTLAERIKAYGARIHQSLDVGMLSGQLNSASRRGNPTTADTMRAVNEAINTLASRPAQSSFSITDFINKHTDEKDLMQNWVPDFAYRYEDRQAKKALEALEKVSKDLKHWNVRSVQNDAVYNTLDLLVRTINQEVSAIFSFLQVLVKITDTETRFIQMAHRYVKDLASVIKTA